MTIYAIGDTRPYTYYPGDLVEIEVPPKPKKSTHAKLGLNASSNEWARRYQNKLGIVVQSYWHDDWGFNHHLQIFIQETSEYVYMDTILVKKL